MTDGEYTFYIHQYAPSRSQGFKAEIEFAGNTYSYESSNPVKGSLNIAVVTLNKGEFSIRHGKFPPNESTISKEIWGVKTGEFHKVNLLCSSPNKWGDNDNGNKHYMFMLEECAADEPIRGFHNENFNEELSKHRKVTEVLGLVNMIEPTEKHLAGIGFNSTVREDLIVKCKGSFQRTLKIKF